MQNIDLDSPSLFINREMSWLEFNDRVLREGLSADVPLMERVKFLSIVSSNLDEFFMIRVAGLRQQVSSGVNTMDVSGMSPTQQLEAIAERTRRLVAEQSAGIVEATTLLCEQGLCLLNLSELSPTQRKFIDTYFDAEVLPLLTPLAAEGLNPFPILPGLALNLGLMIPVQEDAEVQERIAIVPIPLCLPRFINIPGEKAMCLVPIEQVIAGNIGKLFGLPTTPASTVFRITRDADVAIKESQAADMISIVEKAVRARRRRSAVRLEISKGADPRLMQWLTEGEYLPERGVYEIDGLIDPSALMQIFKMRGFERLHEPDWPPQAPQDLIGSENIFQTLQERDVLLFHPYETFAPVVQMIQQAADDPGVLAIKQTLYRTSGDSPIIAALARAAERGKQVTVLVELKARFDEANNVNWARTLEDAGCHVIYGISGVKTHAKLLLIIRREPHGIRRYIHLSTGNYNDRTARLYSDFGLMTSDKDFGLDASAFFNLLTGYSQVVGWQEFVISPFDLRRRFLEMIDREIRSTIPGEPGLIMLKMNSLQDKDMIRALYRASQAGVKVRLNVRGICCLKPGIPGVSENIEVVSIVDRFLEHARIYYFYNAGHEEVYLSSADLMKRNLDGRLEIMFPIIDPARRLRIKEVMELMYTDNAKARRLKSDGVYESVPRGKKKIRIQEILYKRSVEAAKAEEHRDLGLQPLEAKSKGKLK